MAHWKMLEEQQDGTFNLAYYIPYEFRKDKAVLPIAERGKDMIRTCANF